MTYGDGDTVLDYMTSLSNWGPWGPDDRLGTISLITNECRRAAAALVSEGINVSCAHDIDPTVLDPIHQFHRYMVVFGEGLGDAHRVPHMAGAKPDQRWNLSREYIGMVFHGPRVSHLDVVVFLRTGKGFVATGGEQTWNWRDPKSGWSAACLPWLRERDVAMIGHDGSNAAAPSGYESLGFPTPIHVVSLVAMGLWLLDKLALDELAATCQRLGRWEFMIPVAPWRWAPAALSIRSLASRC